MLHKIRFIFKVVNVKCRYDYANLHITENTKSNKKTKTEENVE